MSMENFSPDNCFDEMAKVLMPDREPTEVGYIELLEEVKKLKKSKEFERVSLLRKIAELKEDNLRRNEDLLSFRSLCDGLRLPELTAECLSEEIQKLKEENEELKEDEEDVFKKMMSIALFGYKDSSLGPIKMVDTGHLDIGTVPGLVTELCLSPKDFSF